LWAFLSSDSAEGPTNDALLSYVVATLETAPPDVLMEVVDLLAAPGRPSPRFRRTAPADSPLGAVRELKDFLSLTWRQVEAATGIDENTFYYWQRAHAKPRPSSVRKLMGVYGLVYALVRSRGEVEALAWLAEGSPKRMDLLLGGETEQLRGELETLFGARAHPPIYHHAFRPEDDYDEPAVPPRTAPRRASRRPVRHRRLSDR